MQGGSWGEILQVNLQKPWGGSQPPRQGLGPVTCKLVWPGGHRGGVQLRPLGKLPAKKEGCPPKKVGDRCERMQRPLSFPLLLLRATSSPPLLHLTDGETGPQWGRASPEATQGVQSRTRTGPWTPGPVPSALQGQLGRARQWGAEDISLNHRVKFRRRRRKKKKKQPAEFPGLEPCPAGPRARGGRE